jgi:acetylornithine deacetylase
MYLPQAADEHGEGRVVERGLIDWIDRAVEDSGDDWLRSHPPTISWGSDIPPAEIEPGHPLSRTMAASALNTGLDSRISGFNSWYDGASFIRTKGIPAVAFGPPETSSAHAIDEGVEIDDLVRTAQALAVAALRWCERV